MNKRFVWAAVAALALGAAGCASLPGQPTPAELDAQALAMLKASFRDEGIATTKRLEQDLGQQACSAESAPPEGVAKRVEAEALASIKWPAGGQYLGDWREGEKLAQNGRGMTWTDKSAAPAANGANCYNCHQISKEEVSFGTIGPSLYNYGKIRGVKDPADPASAAIVQYTWGKLWNSKAYNACSNMPRFGHAGLLNEEQLRHVMALILDPRSPVNQ
ncbi:sulfur oxidation c-type cytochrome SoxX [Paucibacter sediminis]|uniref:Sulfur oxidation c-type cytochrome SoxX n=1 Tax=Paucibacter sediminis TaxID=3019553 RepID=A0AA95N9T3_9BURK|nr:sulfur oxidation c-type cytochrome SoxX [Paucibacter sp. S2-9]WIT11052.1 sulfur oxidation c-type cytochrome SoxX [Paucibacter sp. S2-9]